ncbi:TetR/AcrR family transcriptional regulator [Gordonia iterans]
MEVGDVNRRPGRPRTADLAERKQRLLDAACAELIENGYPDFTVGAVARRAGTSKTTVYSWFGDRGGLLRAMVERKYAGNIAFLEHSLHTRDDVRTMLIGFGTSALGSLLTELSLAISRAAMNDPGLGALVLAGGADRGRPLLAAYLRAATERGLLHVPDADAAAKALWGLVVQDDLSRALLGDDPLDEPAITARAEFAADAFLRIYGPDRGD